MKGTVKILFVCAVLCVALAAPFVIGAKPECSDGIDNDGDGYMDYPADPGCSSAHDSSELNADVQCDDGVDNDGDGAIDMNDGGCLSPTGTDENNCGDGVCGGYEVCDVCKIDCGHCDHSNKYRPS